jgi:hypothetical protein
VNSLNSKRSTTAVGDELRDRVIELLEADGHKVSREIRVGPKKIDVLLEIDDEFRQQKIAVECKNISKNLSQAELNAIYSDHSILLDEGEITGIFVVSKLDFSPEAKQYAAKRRGLDAFSIKEFEDSLLGFRKYCREVRELIKDNGLESYYVQPSIENDGKLHERVMKWVEDDDHAPVAVLGGYGMGKTSYCKFLTQKLANCYLEDPASRIPVYVRLSDIATQTDIDGLIAKTLAGRYSTKNYSFAKFKKLNRAGKFVVIFDGFDEMKHALSWSDFKYNFSQIHSLLDGKAKILVAGRPNAFLSDDEHAWILKGARITGDQVIRIPGAPEYIELPLAFFSDDDVRDFLLRYLREKVPPTLVDGRSADDWIVERVREFDRIRTSGELYRPVHLKIYADIAADPEVKLEGFSTYELYSIATSRISEREGEKVVRKEIDSEKRQSIIERVAWWLWDSYDGRVLHFVADLVPETIIGRALLDERQYERENLYREIFTGSFLERKFGQNYYFSHRSFLEFFVARRLENPEKYGITVKSIFKNINPEILSFLRQSPAYQEFLAYIYKGMQRYSGEMPSLLLEEVHKYTAENGVGETQTAIQVLLRYYSFLRSDILDAEAFAKMVSIDLDSKSQERRETALYFALTVMRSMSNQTAMLALLRALAKSVSWSSFRTGSAEVSLSKYTYSRQNIGAYVFARFARIAAEKSRDGQPIIAFDVAKALDEVQDKRPPKIAIGGVTQPSQTLPPARAEFNEVFEGIAIKDKNTALEVLRAGVM